MPDSIVIGPAAFQQIVIPAARRATAGRGTALGVKSPPTLEVDSQIDPSPSTPTRAGRWRRRRQPPRGSRRSLPGLLFAATLVSAVAALSVLRRLSPSEVLREQ